MKFCKNRNINEVDSINWKAKSQNYLRELEAFLDKADNIEDEELKRDVIFQMLKCDKELTNLAERMFKEYYEKGKELND